VTPRVSPIRRAGSDPRPRLRQINRLFSCHAARGRVEGAKRTSFYLTPDLVGSPGRTRTSDQAVNSRSLYQLSYRGSERPNIGAPPLEAGSDEIRGYIYHQLPSKGAEKFFTNEAIAAIANVSGGDPVVVNRFSRRMLDYAAASTDNTLAKAKLDLATVMSPDRSPRKLDLGTTTERPSHDFASPERDVQLATRMWPDRAAGFMLRTGIAFCLACLGLIATVEFIHPIAEDVADVGAPATNISAKLGEHASASWPAPKPTTTSAAEKPEAVPDHATPTPMTARNGPTPEEALAQKAPALPVPVAAVRPTAELAQRATEATPGAAIPWATPPAEIAALPAAGSGRGTQATEPTPSPNPTPAKLRLSTEEVTALVAQGDRLLALRDISSARLFYERAADAGDGRAALRLGCTFDPAFLSLTHVAVRGDRAAAEFWYSRARELGEPEAEIRQAGDRP
jgi:hypothetical protein